MRLLGRALRVRWPRAVLLLFGVALCAMLVLVQTAASRGVTAAVHCYLRQPGVDLWVAPRGIDNLLRSSGLIEAETVEGIARLPGVARADRVLRVIVGVAPIPPAGAPAQRLRMMLGIGYLPPGGAGGPPTLRGGRPPRGEGEVALDRAAAQQMKVGLGDRVRVNGRAASVVGLTDGTNVLASQLVFFDIAAAQQGSLSEDTSFLGLRLLPAVDPAHLARLLENRFPEVSVHTPASFLENNLREVSVGVLPILLLIAGLGVAVAAVLVALLLQSTVEDQRGQIAVLFAMGARPLLVGLQLARRAAALALTGGAAGLLAAIALGALLDRQWPTLQLVFVTVDVACLGALLCVAAILASVAPLLHLIRVDPLEAFRS